METEEMIRAVQTAAPTEESSPVLLPTGEVVPFSRIIALTNGEALEWLLLPTLAAAGGPGQARVPRGNTHGGEWVDTPGGVLEKSTDASSAMPYELNPARIRSLDPGKIDKTVGKRYGDRIRARQEQNAAVALVATNPANAAQIQALRATLERETQGNIEIAMKPETIDHFLRDGRLKTCFDAGVTGTYEQGSYIKGRTFVEGTVQGAPKGKHPIYGYIPRTPSETYPQYGAFTAVLNPAVKDRSTVTFGDSYVHMLTPIPINTINSTQTRKVLGARNNADLLGRHRRNDYNEAQIHGGVTLGDVEHFRVDRRGRSEAALRLIDEQTARLRLQGYVVEVIDD